jgi:hypothetical protein
MNTITTPRRQVRKGAHVGQAMSAFAFQLPTRQREALQAIAEHRGWSEAEAMRRAIALFLDQNRDLVHGLSMDHADEGAR